MKLTGVSSPSLALSATLLKLIELRVMLSASLSGNGCEWMVSCGGVVGLAGVFSGGETMDGVGDGDLVASRAVQTQ